MIDNMKKVYTIIVLVLAFGFAVAQNQVTGTFRAMAGQQVQLLGYYGFETYLIDSVRANGEGVFSLSYGKSDSGMAFLKSEDGKTLLVVLAGDEDLELEGETLALPGKTAIVSGRQNLLFERYASEHARREQTLSAWDYLEKIYKRDSLFTAHESPRLAIANEKQRINSQDSLFLVNLPADSYIAYYLPLRKLVSSVSTVAQYRTEEIPAAIQAFRTLDYTDNRLWKSGLLQETIEAHFWLLENSGRSLDSVYIEMNKSIDILLENLLSDEQKLNEITEHLFKLLEKRSLFESSAYLALKLLNEQACTIHTDFAAQLESYRAMKKGNTAPDFAFDGDVFAPGYAGGGLPQTLSGIESRYTVVVFGASWCPQCPQELFQLAGLYNKWKEQGIEVVFVSLDVDKSKFESFTEVFPFISTCDYRKWESPVVIDYHVFATPTLYLLDNEREILLRPNSVSQLDAWVDWYLVEGNQ